MLTLYGAAFGLALAGGFLFVPLSIWAAKRWNVFDLPDERKVHQEPVPRWGGLGIGLSFFFSLLLVYLLFPQLQSLLSYQQKIFSSPKQSIALPERQSSARHGRMNEKQRKKPAESDVIGVISLKKQFVGIILGAVFVLLIGMWDDKFKISAPVKLLLQMIAAFIALDYGVRPSGLTLPWKNEYIAFPLIVSQIVTLLWLTGFMNTINLVDGLDGLAAGICAIAAGIFLVVAVLQGQSQVVLFSKQLKLAGVLSASLCGAALSFLWFNFYPAKVFMGDGGALFLGYMLAAITVVGTLKTTAFFSSIIPIIVVALPVLDVASSIYRRLRSGRHVFQADNNHFHHRLLRLGWSHREAVLGVYVVTLVLSIFSILLTVFKGKV